jgi:heme exporter protein D
MDLGPHAAYIWAAYAVETAVLTALVGWLLYDGGRQKRRLSELQDKGITRRGTAPDKRTAP